MRSRLHERKKTYGGQLAPFAAMAFESVFDYDKNGLHQAPETMSRNMENPPRLEQKELLNGVFSKESLATVGFGHTKQKIKQVLHVYVVESPDGILTLQSLNQDFVPYGHRSHITLEELLKDYLPDPEVYYKHVLPKLREVAESVRRGEAFRANEAFFSAELEFKNALRIDEGHVRATFGLGLTYLDRGERENAKVVFKRLIRLDAAFEPEHKHIFNEFGIKLRQNKLYRQAMRYYARALRISKSDEHLLYNMARTRFEQGRTDITKRLLHKALSLNSRFSTASVFLDYLRRNES